ncbi:MAG TPA: AAA family ATPase [Ramlibacter sp.]|nr:AAA family ATPase [Ramlibacter sp.]
MEEYRQHIAQRSAHLRAVAAELKEELFGIDDIIDRAIDALRAWYVLPEIVSRPVIVCLWGLTGTGKTQLVRQIARKLGFYDRFVEVQMDGFSHGSGYRVSSISGMLGQSGIGEGAPGILLLDEFQRFRTMNDQGADIKVERYQDVWALLSDGQLPPTLSFMNDLEVALADALYEEDRADGEDDADEAGKSGDGADARRKPSRRFKLSPYEARELRRSLKLAEPLLEIMGWDALVVRERLQDFRTQPERWGTDYSRLLVFVAGNLDEMYQQVATRVEDCDTDADIFHQFTRKLSVIDAKKALARRFRPEQIARLGNNHLVYPSLNRATYERLVAQQCDRYAQEVERGSGLRVEIAQQVQGEIYANAVYPAQGTRPLFSSVQGILGSTLANATLWALEQGARAGDVLRIALAPDGRQLCAHWRGESRGFVAGFDLQRLKQRTQPDFRALLAVHEAGHALLYGLLLRQVPLEVKINVASFDGGYNSFLPLRARSRRDVLDMVCVGLGGRAAEALVFGPQACTTGAVEDLRKATADAAEFVRQHGFAGRLSRTDAADGGDCDFNTSVGETDPMIEGILAAQYNRAQSTLAAHAPLLARMAQLLVAQGEIPRVQLAGLLGLEAGEEPAVLAPYAQRLAQFVRGHADPGEVLSRPALPEPQPQEAIAA